MGKSKKAKSKKSKHTTGTPTKGTSTGMTPQDVAAGYAEVISDLAGVPLKYPLAMFNDLDDEGWQYAATVLKVDLPPGDGRQAGALLSDLIDVEADELLIMPLPLQGGDETTMESALELLAALAALSRELRSYVRYGMDIVGDAELAETDPLEEVLSDALVLLASEVYAQVPSQHDPEPAGSNGYYSDTEAWHVRVLVAQAVLLLGAVMDVAAYAAECGTDDGEDLEGAASTALRCVLELLEIEDAYATEIVGPADHDEYVVAEVYVYEIGGGEDDIPTDVTLGLVEGDAEVEKAFALAHAHGGAWGAPAGISLEDLDHPVMRIHVWARDGDRAGNETGQAHPPCLLIDACVACETRIFQALDQGAELHLTLPGEDNVDREVVVAVDPRELLQAEVDGWRAAAGLP